MAVYLAVVAFAVAGALIERGWLGYVSGRLGHPDTGGGNPARPLVVAAIVAVATLVVVGSIGYVIFVRGKPGTSWSDVTFGRAAIGITLVLLCLRAAGGAASHNAAISAADAAWTKTRTPVLREFDTAVTQNRRFSVLFKRQGNTVAARQLAAIVERELQDAKTGWDALPPSSTKKLRSIDADIGRSMGLAAAGFGDYLAGLNANAASGIRCRTTSGQSLSYAAATRSSRGRAPSRTQLARS